MSPVSNFSNVPPRREDIDATGFEVLPGSAVWRRLGLAKKGVRYFLSSVSKLALQHPHHQSRELPGHDRWLYLSYRERAALATTMARAMWWTRLVIRQSCTYSWVKLWSFLGSSGFLCRASSRLDGLVGSLGPPPCRRAAWSLILLKELILFIPLWASRAV